MSEINLEDKVMSEIKSGRVKLRSKYIFLAEKLGVGSVLVFTILLAVLFLTFSSSQKQDIFLLFFLGLYIFVLLPLP